MIPFTGGGLRQQLAAPLHRVVVEADGKMGGSGRLRDVLLELLRTGHRDAAAVARHCQAQRSFEFRLAGATRHIEPGAVVADHAGAEAVDQRSLFRHAVVPCSCKRRLYRACAA